MARYDVIAYRDERLLGAYTAFDLWLAANPTNPLIRTRRRVPGTAVLAIFPTERKDVLATREQLPKKCDLFSLRRIGSRRRWRPSWIRLIQQRSKLRLDSQPLHVHFAELLPKGSYLRIFASPRHEAGVRDSRLRHGQSLEMLTI